MRTNEFELPETIFLYTIDQIAGILGFRDVDNFRKSYVFYEGISLGGQPTDKLRAKNIAPSDSDRRDWRVSETELLRWMKYNGFRTYRQRIRVKSETTQERDDAYLEWLERRRQESARMAEQANALADEWQPETPDSSAQ
jgi:hypothetical protein